MTSTGSATGFSTMGKYRSVSTAEKRAELEAKGEPWPVCGCHGEPKKWSATTTRPAGGRWRCRVACIADDRRYKQSTKGREAQNAALRRYNQSEKGREAQRRNPQVYMFGQLIRVPAGFKEVAIAMREERRKQLREAA